MELSQSLIIAYDALLLNNDNSINSLKLIKRLLIGASIGGQDSEDGKQFISLQENFQLNTSLILLTSISNISNQPNIIQDIQTTTTSSTTKQYPQKTQLINQLSTQFILLQGLLHLHPPSQNLFKSEYNLRILLKFLPLALHSTTYSSIGLPLLDLLLITFVDSPANAQLFESAGGLEILVQAMKQKALKTELRVKVLETLWAWWIDEEEPNPENHPILPHIHPHNLDLARPSIDQTPSSRSRPNSRIRPISLPPPSLPEEDELANTSGNFSDGHETPKPNKLTPRVIIQPSSTSKPISSSQSILQPPPPTSFSSPMIKSSSEGSNLNATPSSRTSKSSDPASRLRVMLESTAGQFIPSTPHHPHRTRLATTPSDRPSSPSRRTPYSLHRSHPVCLLKDRSDSHDLPAGRPSESSEDSDRLDLSPHKLFGVRQRRTAIKPSSNTPQRLIRHKQSASLGSIQHQLQLPPTANKPASLSLQSSEDEGPSGSGSAGSEREAGPPRARRSIRSPTVLAVPEEPMAPTDTPRRPSSRLGQQLTSERKRVSCDTPRATRPSTKTPSRQTKHAPHPLPSPAKSSSSSSSSSSCHDEEPDEDTPQRRPMPTPTPIKLHSSSRTPANAKTLITPITPSSSTHNNLIVAGKINPSSCNSPHKKFFNKPLSPVHARIYQSDLESIVNATDSDVRPNPALFSHQKNRSSVSTTTKRRRSIVNKPASPDLQQQRPSAPDLTPDPSHPRNMLSPPPSDQNNMRKLKKTGILEKYMANSDELVRSFKEIGVGFKALSRHHHQGHERGRTDRDEAGSGEEELRESKRIGRSDKISEKSSKSERTDKREKVRLKPGKVGRREA